MLGKGSEWHRWEPHVHGPGTLLNNQFGGADPWHTYLAALEGATPKIEVVAVTDYYVTDLYEEVVRQHQLGRMPDVRLVFPNVEMRLDVSAQNGFVNVHLLVNPESPSHLVELRRILSRLQFNAYGDRFDCSREELIRLGRRSNPSLVEERAALAHGATQFKVNFAQLRKVLGESEWAKENILVAVAGGQGDGTSGVRQAADATIRQEIERFAHIIFSSNPAQREFWLGERSVTQEQLSERYNGCKPCLHGSDAHHSDAVGRPAQDRFSWIKGALTFDALKQACIDPAHRAYVGIAPPLQAMPSQVISRVTVANAAWMETPEIPLNPGLVAIIGARGSGKTALADIVAAGCGATSPNGEDGSASVSPSFLVRAQPLLGNAQVTITWGSGALFTRNLEDAQNVDPFSYPRARYLSQQFVEELCSAQGASQGLLQEVERVIYEAYPVEEREGATDFRTLLETRTTRFRQARRRDEDAIADLSDSIAVELEKESQVVALDQQVKQKREQIENYKRDLAKIVVKGSEAQVARHTQLSQFHQAISNRIQAFQNQRRFLATLQDEVRSTRATKAPEMLRQLRGAYAGTNLSPDQWSAFLLVFQGGDVESALTGYMAWADGEIAKLQGVPPPPSAAGPLIGDTEDLNGVTQMRLKAEMFRLEALIGADAVVRRQYTATSTRIVQETALLQNLEARLVDAQGAAMRRRTLQNEREASYGRVMNAVISEQGELTSLYSPLLSRLQGSSGTLGKLGFVVTRVVDARAWAEIAEESLIDRRKAGPFSGRGTLSQIAIAELQPIWERGQALEIQAAMSTFVGKYWKNFLSHAPDSLAEKAAFRDWLKQFAHWLYSTDHISIRYEIEYDRVDIRKLSPGTRGIVLLLLYLALDDADDRPLIIDQPEENLDPKSVFDELVTLFIAAKKKRQVIIVTHNANLVVNTDADQIIVASTGPHPAGGLPPISYAAGGLEDLDIRKKVCDILEGGDKAFRERARRLRVRLNR